MSYLRTRHGLKDLTAATVLLIACLLSGVAATEPEPAKNNSTHQVCEVLAGQILSTEEPEMELQRDGCLVKNGKIAAARYGYWIFDIAQLSGNYGSGSEPFPAIPSTGRIQVNGVRFTTGRQPASDYLSRVQQAPLSLELSYNWNRDTKRLTVDHVAISSDRLGKFSLSASLLLGFEPTLVGLGEPQERPAAVEEASVKLENKGLFELYAMGPVVSSIGYDVDPEPIVEKWKVDHMGMLASVSQQIASAATVDAFKRFIADVPHPKGVAEFSLRFQRPISVVQLLLGGMSFDEILGHAHVEATYSP